VVPSTEQPAAGNGTPIDVSAAAAGGAATNGSAGTNGIAAAGSSMAAAASGAGGAAPVDTPRSTGCENGAFFCEDFDGLTHGALPPGVNGMQPERTANVTADAERGQVLQLQAAPGYGNKAGIFLNNFSHPDNGSHFGRMFVNVGAFPVLATDHWVMVEVTGSDGDQVRPVGGQFDRWAPGADGLSAGDWTEGEPLVIRGEQWVTIEVEVRGSESVTHTVNGTVTAHYTNPQYDPNDSTGNAQRLIQGNDLMLREGMIALQAESHPTDFRKVEIMLLDPNAAPTPPAP
jgi:Domain of Unknown Function (DUF1080)